MVAMLMPCFIRANFHSCDSVSPIMRNEAVVNVIRLFLLPLKIQSRFGFVPVGYISFDVIGTHNTEA